MVGYESSRAEINTRRELRASVKSASDEYNAADVNKDGDIDFAEYCAMPANQHMSLTELREEFDELDDDKSGAIDRAEYLRYSLVYALASSHTRVSALFNEMDTDGSKRIDKREFRAAIKSLGYNANRDVVDHVFEAFDEDGSGELTHKELTLALKPETVALNRHMLRSSLVSPAKEFAKASDGPKAAPTVAPAEAAGTSGAEPGRRPGSTPGKGRYMVHAAPNSLPLPARPRARFTLLGLELPDLALAAAFLLVLVAFRLSAAPALAGPEEEADVSAPRRRHAFARLFGGLVARLRSLLLNLKGP